MKVKRFIVTNDSDIDSFIWADTKKELNEVLIENIADSDVNYVIEIKAIHKISRQTTLKQIKNIKLDSKTTSVSKLYKEFERYNYNSEEDES